VHAPEVLGLRVGTILESRAAAGVSLACEQQVGEALGTAESVRRLEQLEQRPRAQLERAMHLRVMTGREQRKIAMLAGNPQTARERLDRRDARLLVSMVARPVLARRERLAEIVREHGEAHGRRFAQSRRAPQREHRVHARVDLRMPALGLRHAEKGVDLGKDDRERTAVAQHLEIDIRPALSERPLGFLPDPLGNERIELAGCRHPAHELACFVGNGEAQVGEAGREPRHAQHAHGILDESLRNVTQDAVLEVAAAAVRIDDLARGTLGHRIDREITASEILLERDVRREMRDEAAVAGRDLALEARERVLLVRFGMQEHGELAPDGHEALPFELGGLGSDHDPVALAHGQSEQAVTDGAADQVDFHALMLTEPGSNPRRSFSHGRFAPRALLLAVVIAALSGCGTTYLLQAARGQWQVMQQRRPIEEVIADPSTPRDLRFRLLELGAAREFASRELGLPDNGSYRSYADLGRPYVVWNVVATPEFSIHPLRWCFPIAGCVSYRGYFSEQRARAFAERLRAEGHDVLVAGVPAYSTLGRFADPVLNTMLGYGDSELAAIVFHELAHQVVYVPGDTEFNEAFAVAVEQAGLERWLAVRRREAQLERLRERRARQLEYVSLFVRRRAELGRLYATKLPPEKMRERKREIFAALEADIRALEARHGVSSPYGAWVEAGLNNAHLASVATYYECVPGFERLLAEHGGDLRRFYDAARALAALPRAVRRERLCGPSPSPRMPEVTEAGTPVRSPTRSAGSG